MTIQYILFSGHTNIVLATFENPASISPYRVNTSYRRPTGGESDHGYSTMTPHEDSEQASTTCLEPLIIGRDRYRPSSTNSSVISKPGALPPPPGINRAESEPHSPTDSIARDGRSVPRPPAQQPSPRRPCSGHRQFYRQTSGRWSATATLHIRLSQMFKCTW